MEKKRLFIDMDGCIVDFVSGIWALNEDAYRFWHGRYDEHPMIFEMMKPMPGAIGAYKELCKHYDVYTLSTSPWDNPNAASQKIAWMKKYLPEESYKRVILSHNKHLCHGDYLIDDRLVNGAAEFPGEHLHFGKGNRFPDWDSILEYLLP